MREARTADERDAVIARLEQENARLVERLTHLRPALHGLTEDLVRAHRDTAEWRRRYRELAAQLQTPRRSQVTDLRSRRDAA